MNAKSPLTQKKVFIGTSGYSYSHWKDVFYPGPCPRTQWLEFYSQQFNSVELNVTFYRLPRKETFTGWYDRTPAGFAFTVKGSRYITHIKRLKDCTQAAELFFDHAAELKEKLRCVLWQFPGSFRADPGLLKDFLSLLGPLGKNVPQCFEFRHDSWFKKEILSLLREHEAGLCISDSPDYPCPEEHVSSFAYFRFHGTTSLYGSRYSGEQLKKWVDKIVILLDNIQVLFAFFNNDLKGYAVQNALQFKKLLDERI